MMAFNASTAPVLDLPPLPEYTLKPLPPLLPWISDANLSPLLLIVAYWALSGIFHLIDVLDLFPQYRLHTPQELLKRNHASRWNVFRDVIFQQIIQAGAGFFLAWLDGQAQYGKEEYEIAKWAQWIRIAQRGVPTVLGAVGLNSAELGKKLASPALAGVLAGGKYPGLEQEILYNGKAVTAPAFAQWELSAAWWIYYVVVPSFQFFFATVILDTWQYFCHRAMHMNHWLYTTLHARHHRLYVPYAYGALYNHPVEGFLLDTLGSGVAYLLMGLTERQGMIFFTFSTCKTVDDHCGYALPWDPLQHISGNNATYHDIHHQSWGIKTNFSQPYFTFWDRFLNTMWRGDTTLRYEKQRRAADEWWEQQKLKALAEANGEIKVPAADASGSVATATTDGKSTRPAPLTNGVPNLPSITHEHTDATSLRRSPRKSAANQASLKGLKDRVSGSLPNGVPRVDSRR